MEQDCQQKEKRHDQLKAEIVGTAETDDGFDASSHKAWLYIERCKSTTTQ